MLVQLDWFDIIVFQFSHDFNLAFINQDYPHLLLSIRFTHT